MTSILDYLKDLTHEQLYEAIHALPREEQVKLALSICREINDISKAIVENKEQIWEDRALE